MIEISGKEKTKTHLSKLEQEHNQYHLRLLFHFLYDPLPLLEKKVINHRDMIFDDFIEYLKNQRKAKPWEIYIKFYYYLCQRGYAFTNREKDEILIATVSKWLTRDISLYRTIFFKESLSNYYFLGKKIMSPFKNPQILKIKDKAHLNKSHFIFKVEEASSWEIYPNE